MISVQVWSFSTYAVIKQEPQCPDGMVSYWKFNEGQGATASDSKGSNNGTIHGLAWSNDKAVGSALYFNGQSGNYLTLPNDASLNPGTGAWSAEFWAKMDTDFGYGIVLIKRNLAHSYWDTWDISIGYDSNSVTTVMYYQLRSPSGGNENYAGTYSGDLRGTWHHFAFTRPADGNGRILGYMDGNLLSDNGQTRRQGNSIQPSANMLMGVYADYSSNLYKGMLDEVAVYNKELSIDEIRAHYNSGIPKDYCGRVPAPTEPENCTNGIDDNGNGLIDCFDASCEADPACQVSPVEICNNGVDDNGNGLIDCADADCSTDSICLCGNGVIDGAEECDGSDLNEQTCATYDYDGGSLACTQDCYIDYTACYNYPTESAFTIGSATAEPGDSVDIPISLFNGDSIAGIQFIFQYPGLLQYQGIDSTSRTDSGTIAVNPDVPGIMRFAALYGITPTTQLEPGVGEIYTLHFIVSEDAASGEYPLTVTGVKVGDISANQLPYGVTDGTLTIENGFVDTEPPSTTVWFTGTEQNEWFSSDVTAEIEATDDVAVASVYYCLSTPSAPNSCHGSQYTQIDSSYVTFDVPAAGNDGISTLHYYAVDTSGNAESAKIATIQIDATAPSTTDDIPPWWVNYDFSITVDASDAQSGVNVTYLCIASTPSCTPVPEPPQYNLDDGIYFIRYYSVDNAGNAEEEIKTKALSIDRAMPVTSATVAGTFNDEGWTNASVDITLSGYDPGSAADPNRGHHAPITGSGINTTYQCTSFEGNDCAAYTQTDVPGQGHQLISGEGRFIYRYYSEDNGGRISPYSEGYEYSSYDAPNTGNAEEVKEIAVNIDTSAPSTTMESSCSQNSCTVTLSAEDPALASEQDGSGIAKVMYKTGAGSWQEYNGAFTVTGEGRNYVMFYAIDNAGNAEAIKEEAAVIDNTPPVLTAMKIGTQGKNGWYTSPVTVVIKATEPTSDITEVCSDVDGSNEKCGKDSCETG
jgi:hypothetical protein